MDGKVNIAIEFLALDFLDDMKNNKLSQEVIHETNLSLNKADIKYVSLHEADTIANIKTTIERKGSGSWFGIIGSAAFIDILLPIQIAQYIIQLPQTISQNKTTLDIVTDFATVIGAKMSIPIAQGMLKVLHKKKEVNRGMPSVIISIGDVSVTITDKDIKSAEATALRIAKKLIQQNFKPNSIYDIKLLGTYKDATKASTIKNQQLDTNVVKKRSRQKRKKS